MKETIQKIIEENPNGYTLKIRRDCELMKFIDDEFQKIRKNTEDKIGSSIDISELNLQTKIYFILNDYKTIPECPVCHKIKNRQNIIGIFKGFSRCCSKICSIKDPHRVENMEKTMIKRYGVSNFFVSEDGKRIKKEWCEKNGVDNPFQLGWVNNKAKETRKRLYGVEYTMQSKDKRVLARENYIKRHGYDSQFHDPSVIKKIRGRREEKIKNGIDEKTKYKTNARKRRYNHFLSNKHVIPSFTLEEFEKLTVKTQYTTLLKWHCIDCGNDFESFLDQNLSSREHIPARCPKCHPNINYGYSKLEKDVFEFIKNECDRDVCENDNELIKPFELDIVSKSKKLCFEFDGLYWHSENGGNKGKYYHLSKTEKVESIGYQLIHIFEDEWVQKREIVKSRIKNLFGIYDKTVYARKCEVRKVLKSESIAFQNENHLQGYVGSKVSIGLFSNNILISIMTFGKPRFNKKYEWELLRFCNKLGYHVIGGASKLLRYFERNYKPKSMISYADRRWSKGSLYEKIGFSYTDTSKPSYFYTKTQKRYSRMMFQKHKLEDKLEKYERTKTERENMTDNGYDVIWDCGNLVYTKEYNIQHEQ